MLRDALALVFVSLCAPPADPAPIARTAPPLARKRDATQNPVLGL